MTTKLRGWIALLAAAVLILFFTWHRGSEDSSPESASNTGGAFAPELARPGAADPGRDGQEAAVRLGAAASADPVSTPRLPEIVPVEGRVVDERLGPLAGGRVVVFDEGANPLEVADVDDQGQFTLRAEGAIGPHSVAYRGVTHGALIPVMHVRAGDALVVHASALAKLELLVVDRGGAPVEDAEVHGECLGVLLDELPRTDARGRVFVRPDVGGTASFMVKERAGKRYGWVTVPRPHEARTSPIEVRLEHELRGLRCRVVAGPASAHLVGTPVALRSGFSRHHLLEQAEGEVGGEPVWVFSHVLDLPRIKFAAPIIVSVSGQEPWAFRVGAALRRQLGTDGVFTIEVADRSASVRIRLVDQSGAPVPNHRLDLRRVNAAAPSPLHVREPVDTARTDEDGVGLLRLSPATYALEGVASSTFSVPEQADLQFSLPGLVCWGTVDPPIGRVFLVPAGSSATGSDWAGLSIAEARRQGRRWTARIEGTDRDSIEAVHVDPGGGILSRKPARVGPQPTHLEIEDLTRAPHRTRLRVVSQGRTVHAVVHIRSIPAAVPGYARSIQGAGLHDLSDLPRGEYLFHVVRAAVEGWSEPRTLGPFRVDVPDAEISLDLDRR